MMASNHLDRVFADASLARDPRRPRTVQAATMQPEGLNLPAAALREGFGKDPYNTSESFDRAKNWVRVGKR